MRISRHNVVVTLSACVLTGFVYGQSADAFSGYTSDRQAFQSFQENEDALVREQAYDWMKEGICV